jgi:PAS domain S-box-containing protein
MQVETRILVVEDDAITAMDIKNHLEKLHYKVVATAPSGEEALDCVEKLHPNLIVMDIVLKGNMDGIAASQAISSSHSIPVIFLTAYRDDEGKFNRAKLTIPYGYITKPFETRDLHIAIQLALVRKEMEDKLALKERRYQLLMDNATCGIVTSDENGIINDINKQAAAIFARDKPDIINHDFREYLPASENGYATLQMEKLTIEKRIGPNKRKVLQPSGAIRDIEFSAACVESQTDKLYLYIIEDITEKSKLLEQSLLAYKMSSIGVLTLGIIHEINNPLNWLLSNLQSIKEKIRTLPAQDTKSHRLIASFSEYTNECIEGAQKIALIVHDLKAFSHVENKNIIPVDINAAISSAIHIVEHEVKHSMQLKMELCGELPFLLLSTNRLQQVFVNLIVNAAQSFSNPKNPKNLLIIKTTLERNNLRIDFTDNGSGIKPENMDKLFIPFFTTKSTGIGLGLSISYNIIKTMGGEIHVKSTVDKGTTFSVTLPLSIKAAIDPDIKINTTPKAKLKILIIDDLPYILNTLGRLLEDEQIVTLALGGREGLHLLETSKTNFDLIITDINMPDVSGIDIYRYIKNKHPEMAKQIIFLTGGSPSKKINNFLGSIKNPCLEKPFTLESLTAAIASIRPATEEG